MFDKPTGFGLSNLSAMMNYSVTAGLSYLMSLYLQVIQGFSSQTAGLIMVSQPVIMALFTTKMGKLSDRISPFKLSSGGMAVTGAGVASLIFMNENTPLWAIILALLVIGFGFAMFSSPNTNAIMSGVDKKDYGVASSLVSTMRSIGQSVGMVVILMISSFILGATPLAEASHPLLLKTLHISFGVSTCICIAGIFVSLKRNKA